MGPFGLALTLYSVKVNPFWANTDKIPMKIRLGMTTPLFRLVFSYAIKSFFVLFCFVLFFFFCFFFFCGFFLGGGGLKTKVGGRSRDRTETCMVVLPYREPEGINSFNPGQPIPLQTLHVSTLVETAPNQSFLYLRFYTDLKNVLCQK